MSDKDIDEVYNMIRKSSRDELNNLDGLSRDRADIILPAVSVFKTLYKNRCEAIHIFKKWLT